MALWHPKDEVPQEVLAILVQIRCQQYQWALSLRRNLEESTIGIVAKLVNLLPTDPTP